MKKTRIIASLLCIMMVVCALPMMASASTAVPVEETAIPTLAPANLGEAIAGVMNEIGGSAYTTAFPLTSVNNWGNCNLDFATAGVKDKLTFGNGGAGITFDDTNGATFSSTQGVMRYYVGEDDPYTGTNTWGPTGETGYYAFSFKLQENGQLTQWNAIPWDYNVGYVELTPSSVKIKSATKNGAGTNHEEGENAADGNPAIVYYNNYVPGTEWNDVLIYNGGHTNPYYVYMKKATDTAFTKVAYGYRPANVGYVNVGFGDEYTNNKKGVTFLGINANVGYATSYKGSTSPVYKSIDDIAGGPVASAYAFEFNTDFDLDDWSRTNGGKMTTSSEGVSLSGDNGLTLTNGASWNFYAYEYWSPMNSGSAWTEEGYRAQMVYFKTKGIMSVLMDAPGLNDGKAIKLDFSTTTGTIGNGGGTSAVTLPSITYQDEWMEYLVVPKATAWNAGYSLYAKGEKSTGGRWIKISETSSYGSGSTKTTGITLTGDGGSVKEIRLYKPAVTETANQDASFKWFGEEMTEQHSYNNLAQNGVVYSDGSANFPAGGATASMNMSLAYAPIPVGGYAEFRTRSNGVYSFTFYDGEKVYSATLQKDHTAISGSSDYIGEGNSTWRTWRIARTEEGYIAYCQVDGDTGWLATDVVSSASTNTPGIQFRFYGAQSDSQNTKAQLDYLRIYGPAPENKLTVTNGVGTLVMKDGDKAGYGIIRPIVTAETGKLLLVHYNGENMVKASIYNVEDMTEQQFMYTNVSGADRYKVFLWDGFSGLNRLAPVVTLGL